MSFLSFFPSFRMEMRKRGLLIPNIQTHGKKREKEKNAPTPTPTLTPTLILTLTLTLTLTHRTTAPQS